MTISEIILSVLVHSTQDIVYYKKLILVCLGENVKEFFSLLPCPIENGSHKSTINHQLHVHIMTPSKLVEEDKGGTIR
jgi:hypothetical protein